MMYHIAFVCIHHSCQSQMAEGWLNYFPQRLCKDNLQSSSGGRLTQPIHPYVIDVMKESNTNSSHYRAESLCSISLDRLTHIRTVYEQARELCPPTIPGIIYSHWSISNTAKHQGYLEEQYAIFRIARDKISDQVQRLVTTLI